MTCGRKPQRPSKVSGTRVISTSRLQELGHAHTDTDTHTHTHAQSVFYRYIYHLILCVLLLLMLNWRLIQDAPLVGFIVAFSVAAVGCFVVIKIMF